MEIDDPWRDMGVLFMSPVYQLDSLDQHLHLLKLYLMTRTHILLDKGRALQKFAAICEGMEDVLALVSPGEVYVVFGAPG